MKYFVIGIWILCFLVGLCIYADRAIAERTAEITVPLEQALAAIQAGDDQTAQACVARASQAWEENEKVFASFLSHDHTNSIREELSQLSWLQGNELGQRIEKILKQVQGLAEMDQIIWKNIL